MSNFEDTTDDIENWFLANPEDVSLLMGLTIDLDNLIEQTHDEINRGRLITLKNIAKQQFDNSKHKISTWKTTCTKLKLEAGQKQ